MPDGICHIVFRVILKRLPPLWKHSIDRVFLDWIRNPSRTYSGPTISGFEGSPPSFNYITGILGGEEYYFMHYIIIQQGKPVLDFCLPILIYVKSIVGIFRFQNHDC